LYLNINTDKKEPLYYIKITTEGIFQWNENLSEVLIEQLLKQNAPAVLLSYARTSISFMTISAGLPSLDIPLLDLT